MPTNPHVPRSLPERPSLRHLKDQAKDLVKADVAPTIAAAQFQIARVYGFASWPKLKAHVDSLYRTGQLRRAIDANDLARVQSLMTAHPELHRAPLGYGKNGPLTWVAECRVPWEPPGPARLAMAKWMIENGSDVHQGGDGPLSRAALNGDRIAMMELLVAHGADVDAEWGGFFPIIFSPCEALDPLTLAWLVNHGANPNCGNDKGRGTALDYAISTYVRSPERLHACIEILLAAGGATKHEAPGVLDILRGRPAELALQIDRDPGLVRRRFPGLDFGSTGERRLMLQGTTLLHVAAEFGEIEAARLLLDRGADVNAHATVDDAGVGGQTPVFHAATQFDDTGLPMVHLLVERGADLSVRAKLPGYYDRPEEFVECTPLGYATRFPEGPSRTAAFLRDRRAPE